MKILVFACRAGANARDEREVYRQKSAMSHASRLQAKSSRFACVALIMRPNVAPSKASLQLAKLTVAR